MRPATTLKAPAGGWRGLNPQTVLQVAQTMAARRHIAADTPLGRRLTAAWRDIDPAHPDMTEYARLVGSIEATARDYEQAFSSLLKKADR
jgi:hypothetical protein